MAAALGAAVIVGGFNAASIAGLAASATVLDTCNVRSEASATSSAVTQASKDSTVEVGDPVTNDAGETWYPVTLSDGTTGYIKSNLLNIEETASTTTDTTTTTTDTQWEPSEGYSTELRIRIGLRLIHARMVLVYIND